MKLKQLIKNIKWLMKHDLSEATKVTSIKTVGGRRVKPSFDEIRMGKPNEKRWEDNK